MPSPLAHSSVGFLLWQILPSERIASLTSTQKLILVGGVLLAANGPDLDIAIGIVAGEHAMAYHGGATHSITAAVVFACVFAPIMQLLTRLPAAQLWLVGFLGWISHAMLDACTRGHGMPLLWPFSETMFSTPVPLFFGVRHSQPWAFDLHAITLLTETPFVLLMYILARRVQCSKRRNLLVCTGSSPREVPT